MAAEPQELAWQAAFLPSSFFRPLLSDSLQNFGLLASVFTPTKGEKWAQEGANIGPQRPWQAAKVEKTACVNGSRTLGISMAGCFYAFLLLPATDFGFSAKFWAASFCFDTGPGEKMGPRRAKMGARCQWRRLRLRGWHRILCKIPWGEVLVHRSPVRKYFSSSPWAAQGAKFEG